MKKLLIKLKNGVFNFFFPPRCVICRKFLPEERICDDCIKEIPYIKGNLKNPQFVTRTFVPVSYENEMRRSVLRYKFAGKTAYAEHFAKLIFDVIDETVKADVDYITWVPVGWKKLRRRGYDQAELIARELSRLTGIPAIPTLKKVRNNKNQHSIKEVAGRRANVVGAYESVNIESTWNKRVLIVDDILTTGSTISECARMLKIAGAVDVFAAAIAKTPQKSKKQLKKAKNSL